jgi:hypothetical protein
MAPCPPVAEVVLGESSAVSSEPVAQPPPAALAQAMASVTTKVESANLFKDRPPVTAGE